VQDLFLSKLQPLSGIETCHYGWNDHSFSAKLIFFLVPGMPPAYATLGRPMSLPVGKVPQSRSSSDPDLPITPDGEVASLMGMGM
jgi:hypothetical protein